MRNLLALLFVMSTVVLIPTVGVRGASSGPSAGLPAGAVLVNHVTIRGRHPCSLHAQEGCTSTMTFEVYKLKGPTAPPPGAVVPAPGPQIAAERATLSLKSSHSLIALGGRTRDQMLSLIVHTDSGCTWCGGPWNEGCPNYLYEKVKWDEQDAFGIPIYHQEQDNEDRVTCQYAWTVWRNVQNCQTYVLDFACQYPIPNGDFWDGTWHQDWSNTGIKFNPAYAPWLCELDTVFLRTYTQPSGWVKANAWRTESGC
jgi:hypothetical protein